VEKQKIATGFIEGPARSRRPGPSHFLKTSWSLSRPLRMSGPSALELDSTEAIKSAVEAGIGIGFVSRWAIAKDLRLGNSFKIVEVEGLRIKREFLVAYSSGLGPHGVAIEFRRFLTARIGPQLALFTCKRS
jgi:DNA-binding transcriptional LysR family regulator